jgi:hypothetical protein
MDGVGSMGWGDDRRMSTSKSRWAAVQIRSQELPSLVSGTKGHAASGASAFAFGSTAPAERDAKPKHSWREVDLRRALMAARGAKLRNYRVEIAPNGTISIVVTGA